MLIAQISDPHITEKGKKAYGIAPSNDNLARTILHINRFKPKIDVVLVSGDIANDCLLKETQHAQSLLNELNCPYYIVPGNHDDRENLFSVFGGKAIPAIPSVENSFINYVVEEYDVRLIGMDSVKENSPGGEICQTRLQWLSECLAREPHKSTIIFMHHPPIKCSVLETDIDGFEGAEEFGELIAKFSNIKAIICGHIHLPTHSLWNGSIVSTAPSTGMQLGLDLSMQKQSEFYLNETGYRLHHFTKHKDLISHTIYVRENNDGPYPFIEHRDGSLANEAAQELKNEQ